MNHATSYQHCHDWEGERASQRQDAIERRGYVIIEDKDALQSVIDELLNEQRHQAKIVRVLAGLYVAEMAKKPEWFSPSLQQREVEQLAQDIADAINAQAATDIDSKGGEMSADEKWASGPWHVIWPLAAGLGTCTRRLL